MTRELNYEAIDGMKNAGFDEKYILEALVKTLDADKVNDSFAYIYRVHDFTEDNQEAQTIYEKLKPFEKD